MMKIKEQKKIEKDKADCLDFSFFSFWAAKENSQVWDETRGRGKNVADATRTAFSADRPSWDEDMTEFSQQEKTKKEKSE